MAAVEIDRVTDPAEYLGFYPSEPRSIDRCQNGVIWVALSYLNISGNWTTRLYYSDDEGATWSAPSEAYTPGANDGLASFFIDIDDYAHLTYLEPTTENITYQRGTPNAGRTSYSWSSPVTLGSAGTDTYFTDLVAHREGTGWTAHVVWSERGTESTYIKHRTIDITSGGSLSARPEKIVDQRPSFETWVPSIDFAHTGDGKTALESPDLYLCWISNYVGGENSTGGPNAKKGTYQNGEWYWSGRITFDNASQMNAGDRDDWLVSIWDGGNYKAVGSIYDSDPGDWYVRGWEYVPNENKMRQRFSYTDGDFGAYVGRGNAVMDNDGNMYVFTSYNGSPIIYRRWSRISDNLESAANGGTFVDSQSRIRTNRHTNFGKLEYIYGDYNSGTDDWIVYYDSPDTKPMPPQLSISEVVDLSKPLTLSFQHQDIEGSTQTGYAVRRRKATLSLTDGSISYGSYEYWTGSAWTGTETFITSTDDKVTIDTTWPTNDNEAYEIGVATQDSSANGDYATFVANPFEWWDGEKWVQMEEQFVTSGTEELTLPPEYGSSGQITWTVRTGDSIGDTEYATMQSFSTEPYTEGWNSIHI